STDCARGFWLHLGVRRKRGRHIYERGERQEAMRHELIPCKVDRHRQTKLARESVVKLAPGGEELSGKSHCSLKGRGLRGRLARASSMPIEGDALTTVRLQDIFKEAGQVLHAERPRGARVLPS